MNVAEMTRVSAILSPAGGRWAGTGQRVLLLDTSHETTYERVHAHMHASPELFGLKGQIEIAQPLARSKTFQTYHAGPSLY